MDECAKNPKLATFGPKLESWWVDFWTQPDAMTILEENYKEHWGKVIWEVTAMRTKWELGYYHGAGKSFGRFWNTLIGRPDWSDHQDSYVIEAIVAEPVVESDRSTDKAVAMIQSHALKTMGMDYVEKLTECIIPDPVEYAVFDASIKALKPFNKLDFFKY